MDSPMVLPNCFCFTFLLYFLFKLLNTCNIVSFVFSFAFPDIIVQMLHFCCCHVSIYKALLFCLVDSYSILKFFIFNPYFFFLLLLMMHHFLGIHFFNEFCFIHLIIYTLLGTFSLLCQFI